MPSILKLYQKQESITIEIINTKVIGQLTSLSCPCHNDTSEVVTIAAEKHKINQECKSQSEPADRPIIKPTISQFYYVRYAFLNVKSGKEVQQTLPAICIENDLEEHLHFFLYKQFDSARALKIA